MTVNETANVLRVSRETVYRLLRDGAIRAVIVGKRKRFRLEDVNAYIERQRQRDP